MEINPSEEEAGKEIIQLYRCACNFKDRIKIG